MCEDNLEYKNEVLLINNHRLNEKITTFKNSLHVWIIFGLAPVLPSLFFGSTGGLIMCGLVTVLFLVFSYITLYLE